MLLPILLPDMDLDWALDDRPRVHSTLTPSLVEPAGERLGVGGHRRGPTWSSYRPWPSTGPATGWGTAAGATTGPWPEPDRTPLRVALLHDGELTDEPLPARAARPAGARRRHPGRRRAPLTPPA